MIIFPNNLNQKIFTNHYKSFETVSYKYLPDNGDHIESDIS